MPAAKNRSWSPVACDAGVDGLILFDGVCRFCSRWVAFVVARDHHRRFRFVSIQSPGGQRLAAALGIDAGAPETNAVIVDGVAWFKMDAAVEVTRRLDGWGWTPAVRLLPRRLRDWLYDRVASNRYRLFGRTDSCMVPDPDWLDRFPELGDGPPAAEHPAVAVRADHAA